MTLEKLGKRIVVVGISASGKSAFSRRLAHKTKLPLTLIDSIMWKPGWNYIGDEETAKKLEEISSTPEWIIEGYIVKQVRDRIFERADFIIYLDYSPLVASWRYVKRWWKHRKQARPELEGSSEKFNLKFLKLVWTKGEAISLNKHLARMTNPEKLITLRSPKEAERFLQEI
jgi:adenylate kinase family enzyme